MNFTKSLTLTIILSASLAVSLGLASAQTGGSSNGSSIPGGLVPGNDTAGPVGDVDAQYKFDDGFYQKVQDLILEEPQAGDFGVYDGERYYSVIMVVSRDDGDDRDPDQTARENKDSIVRYLNQLGARDVLAAESLSFVTASIPVADIPGISLRDEIYKMGDGELPVTTEVDTARSTIHATASDLRQSIRMVPDGTGVVVAVVDTGIDSVYLNDKVAERIYCNTGCIEQPDGIIVGRNKVSPYNYNVNFSSHGTQVAQVLAASSMSTHNGIAPGVTILDAMYKREGVRAPLASFVHAIDWSYSRGANVVNFSGGITVLQCTSTDVRSYDMVVNEAVDKGMVVVESAGNRADDPGVSIHRSINPPGCAHNIIVVGGIDDRDPRTTTMAPFSGRGPTSNSEPRLVPHIVAPAVDIQTLDYPNNATTSPRSGTSYAAPQVSATAAMMLQVQPELTPAEIKAALLLGADWQGPARCTSSTYEQRSVNNNCSYARQPANFNTANNAASLGILNNAGFGILDAAKSLRYVSSSTSYVISDHLDSSTTSRQYQFAVTDRTEPVKIILTWMAHPHGGIAEQLSRTVTVPVADLDFDVRLPDRTRIYANSLHQTTEFAVFNPTRTGIYTVTVTGSGLDSINKPVQTFALAGTVPLTARLNDPPVAQANTVTVSPGMEAIVRLSATDQNGDAVSFHVLQDPSKGIITTDELITKTTSRMVYTPNDGFTGTDTFQVTPHDGIDQGTPALITLKAESLPPGSRDVAVNSANVRDWQTHHVTHEFAHTEYTERFTGKSYPVSALYVGSANMEGADLKITTTSERVHTVAIPSNGVRMIEFSPPITVRTATLSADGIDEEAAHTNQNIQFGLDYQDVRMFVGYVPSTCTASGANSACPAQTTYLATSDPALAIRDGTGEQGATDTIRIPEGGSITALSVSVDIDHGRANDLKVTLISPGGATITLHDRSAGSRDGITTTYVSSNNAALRALAGTQVAGGWILMAGDYRSGTAGTLNSWSLSVTYDSQHEALQAPDIDVEAVLRSLTSVQPDIGAGNTITEATGATKGTIATGFLALGTIAYTAGAGQSGIDTVTYTVSDGDETAQGTVYFYINARGNERPTLETIPGIQTEGAVTFTAEATDGDDSSLTYAIRNAPAGATMGSSTGVFRWTPDASDAGDHIFNVVAHDDSGGLDVQKMAITVRDPDNENPTAPVVHRRTTSDTSILLAPDIRDPEGQPTSMILAVGADKGIVSEGFLGANIIAYIPQQEGTDIIWYTTSDGMGGATTSKVYIHTGTSADPDLNVIGVKRVVAPGYLGFQVSATDSNNDLVSYVMDGAPDGATIDTTTGRFSWFPDVQDVGDHIFTVTAYDGQGGFDTEPVAIVVSAPGLANEDPNITDFDSSALQNNPRFITLQTSDPDDDQTAIILATGATKGTVRQDLLQSGIIAYVPDAGQIGTDEIIYVVSDGRGGASTGTVYVHIRDPTNGEPALDPVGNRQVSVPGTLTFSVSASDNDAGDTLTYAIRNAPDGAAMTSDGTFSWTPATSDAGDHTLTVTVYDDAGGFATEDILVTVTDPTSANRNPTASDESATTAGSRVVILPNITDPDGDDLAIIAATGAIRGLVDSELLNDAIIVYTPFEGESGTDTINYTVSDGRGGLDTGTITIKIS